MNLDIIKGEITRLWFCMDFLKIELSSDHNNTVSGSLLPQATALYNNVSVFLCLLQIPYGLPCLGSPGASATCAGLPQILRLWEVYSSEGSVLWLVCERGQVSAAGAFLGASSGIAQILTLARGSDLSVATPAFCTQPYDPDSDLILSGRHWYQSAVHTNKSLLASADLINLGKYLLLCWYWKSVYVF